MQRHKTHFYYAWLYGMIFAVVFGIYVALVRMLRPTLFPSLPDWAVFTFLIALILVPAVYTGVKFARVEQRGFERFEGALLSLLLAVTVWLVVAIAIVVSETIQARANVDTYVIITAFGGGLEMLLTFLTFTVVAALPLRLALAIGVRRGIKDLDSRLTDTFS